MNVVRPALVLLMLASFSNAQVSAELIIKNATIRTMDAKRTVVSAVAIRNGRIVSVGSDAEIAKYQTASTRVIDAKKRLVLPGFNDSHVHLTGVGNWFSHLDNQRATSKAGVLNGIARFARFLPKGRWILGGKLDERYVPTLAELDAITPNHPVFIYLRDPNKVLVNSRTMLQAKVPVQTYGLFTGEDIPRIKRAIPANNATNWAEIIEAASKYAASLGVTSIQDVQSDDLRATLHELDRKGKLLTRVYDCVGLSDWEKNPKVGLPEKSDTAMVRGGCIKWMAEGEDGEDTLLGKRFAAADKASLQVLVHAIGPRSNANTLSAFEYVIAQNGKRDRRLRIEHATRMRAVDHQRVTRNDIIMSMQPALFGLGSDDFRMLYSRRVNLAFGSDASMIDIDPITGIHAAVNSGSSSVTVDQAVAAYTLGAAYAEFQEKEKGTIEVGKLADLVILSNDIFKMPSSAIRSARVAMTIVNGRVVFEAEKEKPRML
ncbi:MAG TPA: amidohydrolase [Pyrinomonadaceae bacterium]|nr:amidohydrolase [Pyrinomonadaceae bacterium]